MANISFQTRHVWRLLLSLTACVLSIGAASTQTNYGFLDLHDFGGRITTANGAGGPDGTFDYTRSDVNGQPTITGDSAGNLYGTTVAGGLYDRGMVWELVANGVYRDLHDFGRTVNTSTGATVPDGNFPQGNVVLDNEGNIYGAAYSGGADQVVVNPNGVVGKGMIFEITKAGKYIDIHDFQDGVAPLNLAIDSGNNLYGVTRYGGTNAVLPPIDGPLGGGTLFEISNSGTYTVLHNFGGNVKQFSGKNGLDGIYPTGVSVDSHGNLFGTTTYGGAVLLSTPSWTAGMAWELSAQGTYYDLHDFGSEQIAGFQYSDGCWPNQLSLDSSGNLFGTTLNSFDRTGPGTLWKINSSGHYQILYFFQNIYDQPVETLGTVAEDSLGDLIGTCVRPDRVQPLWELTPGGQFIVLGPKGNFNMLNPAGQLIGG